MKEPFEYIIQNDIEKMNSYLSFGDINVVNERNQTLLAVAIKMHQTEMVQILLSSYCNVDLADDFGNTCFHYAVIHNRLGYLKMLFKTTGNPLKENFKGQSPLYLACLYGREQMVRLYLEKYDLDLSIKDFNGETVFMALIRSKNLKLIEYLGHYQNLTDEENCFGNTPLIIAVEHNALSVVKFLIEQKVFVNHKNHLGETALFYAVRNNNKESIDLLLQNGAVFDIKNKNCETLFDISSKKSTKEFLREKIDLYGLEQYKKKFPLHYAIYIDDVSKIKNHLTIKNVNRTDQYGVTPEFLANQYHNRQLKKEIDLLQREVRVAQIKTK
ncbi:MAG: ankyrin repeat domain-containing protein [Anaeroplasmataceae bacterium]|nr:ankyrin repeat domain-containing protein [Anaeroplasmataceae bacterium]